MENTDLYINGFKQAKDDTIDKALHDYGTKTGLINRNDFIQALSGWYWGLSEYNNCDDKAFANMLKKYGLTERDIMG